MKNTVEIPPRDIEDQERVREHTHDSAYEQVVDQVLAKLPPELVAQEHLESYLKELEERVSQAVYEQKNTEEIVEELVAQEVARRAPELQDSARPLGRREERYSQTKQRTDEEQAWSEYEESYAKAEEAAMSDPLEAAVEESTGLVAQAADREAQTPEARMASRKHENRQDQERRARSKKEVEALRQAELGQAREISEMRHGEDPKWVQTRLEIERNKQKKKEGLRPLLSKKERAFTQDIYPSNPDEYVDHVRERRADALHQQQEGERLSWRGLSDVHKGETVMYEDTAYTVQAVDEKGIHLSDELNNELLKTRDELIEDLRTNQAELSEPFGADYLKRKAYAQDSLEAFDKQLGTPDHASLELYTANTLSPIELASFVSQTSGETVYELSNEKGSSTTYTRAELGRLLEKGTLLQREQIDEEQRIHALDANIIKQANTKIAEKPKEITDQTLEEYIRDTQEHVTQFEHIPTAILDPRVGQKRNSLLEDAQELGLYLNDVDSHEQPPVSSRLDLLDKKEKEQLRLAEKHSTETLRNLETIVDEYTTSDNKIHREQVRTLRGYHRGVKRYHDDISAFNAAVASFDKRSKIQTEEWYKLKHKYERHEILKAGGSLVKVGLNYADKQLDRYEAWRHAQAMRIEDSQLGAFQKQLARTGFKLGTGLPKYLAIAPYAFLGGLGVSLWGAYRFAKSAAKRGPGAVKTIDKYLGGADIKLK